MARAAREPTDAERIVALEAQVTELTRQLDWFKRQLFGAKSEKRLPADGAEQPLLTGLLDESLPDPVAPEPTETVSYQRRKTKGRPEGSVASSPWIDPLTSV